MTIDLDAYREQSLATWGEVASGWEERREWMTELTGPVNAWLVGKVDPRPGQVFLDVAAGPGDLGLAVAERVGEDGRVISSDFSPNMSAVARRNGDARGLRNVEYRVLDAERMDLDDDSVDGVVCRWGYMLMADPGAAFAESRRVLRPGGRLSFSVWGAPERNPWASISGAAIVKHGHMPPPEPRAPGIFAMAEEGRIRELVGGAGFEDPQIDEVSVEWRYDDFDDYWRFVCELAGGLAMVIATLSDDEREAMRETMRTEAEPYAVGDGYRMPGLCLNAVTR